MREDTVSTGTQICAAGSKQAVYSKNAGSVYFLYKKYMTRFLYFMVLMVSVYVFSCVMSYKSGHGINQSRAMYLQPENSIDVVMLGTSHIHCGVNTALLWEDYGIAAYDYSAAEQPLWTTYFYLKEICKTQNPHTVVLDLYGPARYKENYQYDWISENVYGMNFSLNKLQMLCVSAEPHKISNYFPSFAGYHSRYDSLTEADFHNFFWNDKENSGFKGYTPYWNKTVQVQENYTESRADGLTEKSEKYLRKIISYTKENDIELVLMVVPYITTAEDQRTYNRIGQIANENGLTFINYNERAQETGLDLENDYNDCSHLNYWGSCKFTSVLGSDLIKDSTLLDRRGQEGYESWDQNVRYIKEELAEEQKECAGGASKK